jgi:hypothetical protein
MPTEEQLLEIHRLALLGAEVDVARTLMADWQTQFDNLGLPHYSPGT